MLIAPKFWQEKNWLAYLLWPVSWLYCVARKIHRFVNLQRIYWPTVPTVSVGNITVGGAGKTPVTLLLAKHFVEQGKQVSVLSKSYGGSQKSPYLVSDNDDAYTVGDEALMLHRSLAGTSAQVWAGKSKVALARRAEEEGAEMLIIDDGFQHDRLFRNVDIVVVDGKQGFGNEFCLPAGPLREPVKALARANFAIIINPPAGKAEYLQTRAYRLQSRLDATVVKYLSGKGLYGFTAIAEPQKFWDSLQQAGLNLEAKRVYADHYQYSKKDIEELLENSADKGLQLVTTQKDMVKIPPKLAEKIVAVPLLLIGEDLENILAELAKVIN